MNDVYACVRMCSTRNPPSTSLFTRKNGSIAAAGGGMSRTNADGAVSLLAELLECCIHAVLHARGVYPASLFERKRCLGVAVMRARHPRLVGYIQDACAGLKEMLGRGQLLALAVVVLGKGNGNGETHVPLERIVFRIQTHESDEEDEDQQQKSQRNAQREGGLEDEDDDVYEHACTSLRAVLAKIGISGALLSRQQPKDMETFELVAYTNDRLAGTDIESTSRAGGRYLSADNKLDWVTEDERLGRVVIEAPKTVPIKSVLVGRTKIDVYAEQHSSSDGGVK